MSRSPRSSRRVSRYRSAAATASLGAVLVHRVAELHPDVEALAAHALVAESLGFEAGDRHQARRQRERGRHDDQARHQGVPQRGPAQQAQVARPQPHQPAGVRGGRPVAPGAHREGGDHRQADQQRQRQGHADRAADLAQPDRHLVGPADDHRREDDDRGQRRGGDGAPDLARAPHRGGHRRRAGVLAAVDRLEHHDRVVHQHADPEHQPHHRQHVQRAAAQVHEHGRPQQRQRDRQRDRAASCSSAAGTGRGWRSPAASPRIRPAGGCRGRR